MGRSTKPNILYDEKLTAEQRGTLAVFFSQVEERPDASAAAIGAYGTVAELRGHADTIDSARHSETDTLLLAARTVLDEELDTLVWFDPATMGEIHRRIVGIEPDARRIVRLTAYAGQLARYYATTEIAGQFPTIASAA